MNPKIPNKFKINIEEDVRDIMQVIIEDGLEKWRQNLNIDKLPDNFRLYYTFHDKEYFGGAHGLFGILYLLIKAYQYNEAYLTKNSAGFVKTYMNTVKASLKYLVS